MNFVAWLLVIYISSDGGLQFLEFKTRENCEYFRRELVKQRYAFNNYIICVGKPE